MMEVSMIEHLFLRTVKIKDKTILYMKTNLAIYVCAVNVFLFQCLFFTF